MVGPGRPPGTSDQQHRGRGESGARGSATGRRWPHRPSARPRSPRVGRLSGRRDPPQQPVRNSCSGGAASRHAVSRSPPSRPARSDSGPSGRGVKRPSQAPHAQRASGSCCSNNSSSNDDLPTPASPARRTSRPCPPAALLGVLGERGQRRVTLEQAHRSHCEARPPSAPALPRKPTYGRNVRKAGLWTTVSDTK